MSLKKKNSRPAAGAPARGFYAWSWHARLAAVIYGLLLIGYLCLAKWLK